MSSVGHGFQIQYPSITLHAISHKIEPGPYIYCQIDEPSAKGTEETVGEEDLGQYWELKIFPTTEETKENSRAHLRFVPGRDGHSDIYLQWRECF